jgi:SAM-dependent methyltransferase
MTPAQAASYPWHQKLPRLGSEEEFAALRKLLEECGYSYDGICKRVKVDALLDYRSAPARELIGKLLEEPIDGLIRLFYDCVYVREDELIRLLPDEGLRALETLNLLGRDPDAPGLVFGTAAILLNARNLTVCDRGNAPDGTKCTLPPDVVYPAIFENTREFVDRLPSTPCEAMLDIGTGTGIAAMRSAPYAGHVWATDISSRCTLFAEFNRRLAGLENMTVVEGDMYAPVEGLTFDRIVTHPPYIPAKQTGLIFRDGGEDGEQIMRRIVEGLPRYLRPGGKFYALLMATDREGEEFEQRIRKWLGADEAMFDVVLVSDWLHTPAELVREKLAKRNTDNAEEWRFRQAMWEATKTLYVFYGWVLIRRHEGGRPAATGRARAGKGFTGRGTEWLLEWESAVRAPGGMAMLLDSRPTISPFCELHIVHRVREGRFSGEEFTLETARPFDARVRCHGCLAQIVSQCDGVMTWRDHFAWAQEAGLVNPGDTVEDFAQVLRPLMSTGLLRNADWPLPD